MPEIIPTRAADLARNRGGKRSWLRPTMLFLVVVLLIAFGAYRGSTARRCAHIRDLGGVVTTGPRPIYFDHTAPTLFQAALRSRLGEWAFQQSRVVYGIDLRGVRDPDDVGSALQAARDFEYLRELTLYQSGVTDDQLAILSTGFPSLARLKINETAITDDGIRHLRYLPSLEMVNVQRTAISDAAVPDLAAIPHLKELSIGETGITSVREIRESHPACHIYSEFVHATRCRSCMQLLNYCTCPEQGQ